MRIDIGIDPDSKKHGAAIAINKQLVELKCMGLFDLFQFIEKHPDEDIHFHIENVTEKNSIFKDKNKKNKETAGEIGRKIGMVQQSMTELVNFLTAMNNPNVHLHFYPISSQWKPTKGGKEMLMRVWGWSGRSNKDTRSAAYFLALGCR